MRRIPARGRSGLGLALTLLVILSGVASAAGHDAGQGETVRVGLYFGDHAPSAVAVNGQGQWQAGRERGSLQGAVRLRANAGHLEISQAGEHPREIGRSIEISPARAGSPLILDGISYRGLLRVEVQPTAAGGLRVVNSLDLEDYLRGVVPNEMFAEPVACEVQAIISRTLAIFIRDHQRRHAREDGFDVCATGHCQVYRGVSSETGQADDAVRRTRGEVLTYHGAVILAAYHANAGGHTAETDEAWPGSSRLPYLSPVGSPYDGVAADLGYPDCYLWQEKAGAGPVRERLRAVTGYDVGEVRGMAVLERWPSGRVKQLRVTGARRQVTLWRPRDIRRALGIGQEDSGKPYDHDLRLVSIRKTPDGFLITGHGAGEGVGLSQQGAVGMARAGFTCEAILGHYYRGTELTDDYGRGRPRPLSAPSLLARAARPN